MAVVSESRLVTIDREADVFVARECARAMAMQAGFDAYIASNIETAISELSTSVLRYGMRGQALLRIDPRGFDVLRMKRKLFASEPRRSFGLLDRAQMVDIILPIAVGL